MSEIATLSQMLMPTGNHVNKGPEISKKGFSDIKKGEIAENTYGESANVENESKKLDSEGKKFSHAYEKAIKKDDRPQKKEQSTVEQEEAVTENSVEKKAKKADTSTENAPDKATGASVASPETPPLKENKSALNIPVQTQSNAEQPAQEGENPETVIPNQAATLPNTNDTADQFTSEVAKPATPNPVPVQQYVEPSQQSGEHIQPLPQQSEQPAKNVQMSENAQTVPNTPEQEQISQAQSKQVDTAVGEQQNTPKEPQNVPKEQAGQTESKNQLEQLEKQPVQKEVQLPTEVEQPRQQQRQNPAQEAPQRSNNNNVSESHVAEGYKAQQNNNPGQSQMNGQQPESSDGSQTQQIEFKEVTEFSGSQVKNEAAVEHAVQPAESASVQTVQTSSRTAVPADQAVSMTKPVEQIISQINTEWRGAEQSIRLTLTPGELGTVRITFSRVDNEVVGMLEVQKSETRRDIEQSLPQLISSIQDNGVPIRRIEVTQWNPNQDGSKENQPDPSDMSQQREFAQQNSSNSSTSQQNRSNSGIRTAVHERAAFASEDMDVKIGNSSGGLNLYV